MRVSDDERRDVARKLRTLAETPDEIGITGHAVIGTLGISAGFYDDCCRSEDVLALADLIDRPTCKDTGDCWTFHCSACGCYIDLEDREGEPTMWLGESSMTPRYCPNCGAMVNEKEK